MRKFITILLLSTSFFTYAQSEVADSVIFFKFIPSRFNTLPINIESVFDTKIDGSQDFIYTNHPKDTIYSKFEYEIGANRFQNLNVKHQQLFNELCNVSVNYDRFVWDGNYKNQELESNRFSGNFNLGMNKYRFTGQFEHNSIERQTNGGLYDIDEFTDTLQNRRFIEVNRELAKNRQRQQGINANLYRITKYGNVGLYFNSYLLDYMYGDEGINDNLVPYNRILN